MQSVESNESVHRRLCGSLPVGSKASKLVGVTEALKSPSNTNGQPSPSRRSTRSTSRATSYLYAAARLPASMLSFCYCTYEPSASQSLNQWILAAISACKASTGYELAASNFCDLPIELSFYSRTNAAASLQTNLHLTVMIVLRLRGVDEDWAWDVLPAWQSARCNVRSRRNHTSLEYTTEDAKVFNRLKSFSQ